MTLGREEGTQAQDGSRIPASLLTDLWPRAHTGYVKPSLSQGKGVRIRPLTCRFPSTLVNAPGCLSLTEIHALEETKFNSASTRGLPSPSSFARYKVWKPGQSHVMGSPGRALSRPVPAAPGDLSLCRFPSRWPPHLPAELVPPRSRCRGSRCPSPMPSRAGSHVPGSAAVPAPPRPAPHPVAGRPAGGRGALWADAGAAPNPPRQMPPVCHRLGDAPGCAATGQQVEQGGTEGDRPGWAEATCRAHWFAETPKFYKVCLVLAWPVAAQDLYTDLQLP